MNFGVIVHSKTGVTLKFGNAIGEKLRRKGHSVEVIKLATDPEEVSGTNRHHKPFNITNLPDASKYDVVLLGCPVWAFTASPVIIEAIKKMKLSGRKVVPFASQGFPLDLLGGKQALDLIGKTAKAQGAEVLSGRSVSAMKTNERIEKASSEIADLFKEK